MSFLHALMMDNTELRSPLAIFVLWHPSFDGGQKYAELIFSEFKRDVSNPLSRGINIPVYFRYVSPLRPIDTSVFARVVVVALVDSAFVLDEEYKQYARDIMQGPDHVLLIPVAIEAAAFNIDLGGLNFARLYERTNPEDYLISIMAHEMLRCHYGRNSDPDANEASDPPLKLFISHAKADGLPIARQIKQYVEESLPLKTFFDTNDIAVGRDFSKEIEDSIGIAVIIAVQSDLYSSREWCRREVLLSKQHNRPIVILNCFQNGETRSFPYMANVLTIHYPKLDATGNNDEIWSHLITAVLKETLRLGYARMYLPYMLSARGLSLPSAAVSAYPPELITALRTRANKSDTFIYPDPPLGSEELAILEEFVPGVKFLTPNDL